VLRTDKDGDVVVETDGIHWRVSSKTNKLTNLQSNK
jgi:hypothetical protein